MRDTRGAIAQFIRYAKFSLSNSCASFSTRNLAYDILCKVKNHTSIGIES